MVNVKRGLVLAGAGVALIAGLAYARTAQSLPKTGVGAKEMGASVRHRRARSRSPVSAPTASEYTGKADAEEDRRPDVQGHLEPSERSSRASASATRTVLSCGWSAKHDLGVMAYLVKPDNGDLDGVWFEEGNTTIGKEFLVGGNNNLLGTYTIKTGEDRRRARRKYYSGTVEVGFEYGVYHLRLEDRQEAFEGPRPAQRRRADGRASTTAGNYGVLQYDIKGGAGKKTTLVGRWVESGTSNKGPGAETMVK